MKVLCDSVWSWRAGWRYGPMWKASFGPILTVHVAEPELIEQVLRTGGPAPHALGPLILEGLPQAPRRGIRTPDGVGTSARSLSIYSSLHACSLSFMIQLKQEPVLHALHLIHQGSVYNNYRLLQFQLGNSNEWLMRTVILNSSNF